MKTSILMGVVGLTLFVTIAAHNTAAAQTGEPIEADDQAAVEQDAAETAEPVRAPRPQLDEILVTAQRRVQDVRDVPIAMNVFGADALKNAGITDTDSLMKFLPNVTGSADTNAFFIRGLGTSQTNQIAEQSVAYMLDDVYVARMDFLRGGLLDMESVQVLKGPQGTLFGRNSPAGVMIQTSRAPDYEWDGNINGTYGSDRKYDIRGAFGGPIIDDALAFRVAAAFRRQDGAGMNVITGNRNGDQRDVNLRGRLRFDATQDLSFEVIGRYFNYESGNWIFGEAYEVPNEWDLVFSLVDPKYEDNLDRQVHNAFDTLQKGHGYMLSLHAKWELGEHTLTSVTSFSHLIRDNEQDADANLFPVVDFYMDTDYDQITQELRFESAPGRFEYVAGAFYMHSKLINKWVSPFLSHLDQIVLDNPAALVSALAGTGIGNLVSGILDPVTGLLGPILNPVTGPNLLEDANDSVLDITVDSYSVFGQMQYQLFDELTLIAGARYTYERNQLVGYNHFGDQPNLVWTVLFFPTGFDADIDRSQTNFSPKVSITYEPFEEVTLYATYAEGYRSGAFNFAAFKAEDLEYEPESARTYEVGVKTEFFDRRLRLNLSAYHSNFENYQLFVFTGVTFVVDNAEEMRSRGVEMDFEALLAEGLTVAGGAAYNDSIFLEYPDGPCVTYSLLAPGGIPFNGIGNLPPQLRCDLSGEQVYRAPRWTGNLRVNYTRPLFDWPILLAVGANASFKSLEYFDADLDPIDSQGAHILFGAQIGIAGIDQDWGLSLSIENLTDRIVKTRSIDMPLAYGAHMGILNRGRTFALQGRWTF